MNTVGNLFHQIEDWGDLRGPKDRPDDLSTDCNFLAINWSFNGGAQCLFWHGGSVVERPLTVHWSRGQQAPGWKVKTKPGQGGVVTWPESACLARRE